MMSLSIHPLMFMFAPYLFLLYHNHTANFNCVAIILRRSKYLTELNLPINKGTNRKRKLKASYRKKIIRASLQVAMKASH